MKTYSGLGKLRMWVKWRYFSYFEPDSQSVVKQKWSGTWKTSVSGKQKQISPTSTAPPSLATFFSPFHCLRTSKRLFHLNFHSFFFACWWALALKYSWLNFTLRSVWGAGFSSLSNILLLFLPRLSLFFSLSDKLKISWFCSILGLN